MFNVNYSRDCSGQQSRDAPAINTAHLTKDDKTQTTKFTDHITVYRPQSSSNSLQATVNPCEELARRMLIVLLLLLLLIIIIVFFTRCRT